MRMLWWIRQITLFGVPVAPIKVKDPFLDLSEPLYWDTKVWSKYFCGR